MARWLRFEQGDRLQFGTLKDGVIQIFQGDMAAATNIEKGGAVSIDGKVRLSSGTDERSGCQMKVCVVGAGAIGGLLAVKLSFAGNAVSVVDRGAHLAAIKGKGLQLRWHDGAVWKSNVKAFDKAAEAGKQDLVVLAVKAHEDRRQVPKVVSWHSAERSSPKPSDRLCPERSILSRLTTHRDRAADIHAGADASLRNAAGAQRQSGRTT